MENNNQTPVEWLEEKLDDICYNIDMYSWKSILKSIEQAKEMESQKDAKYNEMLTDLNDLLESWEVGNFDNEQFVFVKKLIKEATQI
jgi:hypothetical protein